MSGLFQWRKPLDENWATQVAGIEAAINNGETPDYALTKAVANQQLGAREQLKIERLAERIGKLEAKEFTRFEIGLLGSRTLSYISAPLRAAGLARGLLVSAYDAPYDWIASFAFSQNNCFKQPLDAVLVILDESAFQSSRLLLNAAAEDEAVREAERLVSAIADAARSKTGCPAIIATLPPPLQIASAETATPGSSARFRLRVNLMLADGGAQGRWLIWDQAALAARVGLERWLDPISFHSAKVPFSIRACPQAADSIAAPAGSNEGKVRARPCTRSRQHALGGGHRRRRHFRN